jgi:hypothetical protein
MKFWTRPKRQRPRSSAQIAEDRAEAIRNREYYATLEEDNPFAPRFKETADVDPTPDNEEVGHE